MERGSVKCDTSIPYRGVVGSLLRLANQFAKYCCDPRIAHWNASTQDNRTLYSSVNLDVTSKDMKNMPKTTAFFASQIPRGSICDWSHMRMLTSQTVSMTNTPSKDMLPISWQSH